MVAAMSLLINGISPPPPREVVDLVSDEEEEEEEEPPAPTKQPGAVLVGCSGFRCAPARGHACAV